MARLLIPGLASLVALGLAVSIGLGLGSTTEPSSGPSSGPSSEPSSEPWWQPWTELSSQPALEAAPESDWLSGASGDGVTDGALAGWRGRSIEIAGTWNDTYGSQVNQWTVKRESAYGSWSRDLDNAVGAIYKDRGESWSAAASGAYDARWTQMLQNVTEYWGGRPGTLYLRFAHEFNGSWYPWSVSGEEVEDFKAAWRRFRALQLQFAPDAELVFSPSSETSDELDLDWRDAFPGADQVDVMGVDYYNQFPFVRTEQEFEALATATDDFGAPRGLESHRRFAEQVGKPFAVPEWSSNSTMGDSAVFVREFYDWLETHGGTGPGEVLYEILFNVSDFEGGLFQLYPSTDQPDAAQAYRQQW